MSEDHTTNEICSVCDGQLQQVISIYEEVHAAYQNIQCALTANQSIRGQAERQMAAINILLDTARNLDKGIAQCLNNEAVTSTSTQSLLEKRSALVQSLTKMNHHIVKKADDIKSLLRHEIRNMSSGRTAIKGYKPVVEQGKSRVTGSF